MNSCSYLKVLWLLPLQVIDEAQTLIGLAQEKPRIWKKMPNGHPDVASIQCEWGGLGRISLWTIKPHELKLLILVTGEPLLFVQSGQYCKNSDCHLPGDYHPVAASHLKRSLGEESN